MLGLVTAARDGAIVVERCDWQRGDERVCIQRGSRGYSDLCPGPPLCSLGRVHFSS
jgi:hypothetical protein